MFVVDNLLLETYKKTNYFFYLIKLVLKIIRFLKFKVQIVTYALNKIVIDFLKSFF